MDHLKHTLENFGKKIELKAIKEFIGMEGWGFNASLYIDGKRCAFCIDDASGGPMDIQPLINNKNVKKNWEQVEKLKEFIANLPEIECPDLPPIDGKPFTMEYDIEIFLSELVNHYNILNQMRKITKKAVAFRKPKSEYKEGEFNTFKAPTNEETIKRIWAGMVKGRGYTVWYQDEWHLWDELGKKLSA